MKGTSVQNRNIGVNSAKTTPPTYHIHNVLIINKSKKIKFYLKNIFFLCIIKNKWSLETLIVAFQVRERNEGNKRAEPKYRC